MESVYLETSFISYLASEPSRDLVIAGQQRLSNEWWAQHRGRYTCFISEVVLSEIGKGDPAEARNRVKTAEAIPLLKAVPEAELLARELLARQIIPPKAAEDAIHASIAAVHEIDYLLTWNCKHLANAHLARRFSEACLALGFRPPVICTPAELMEVDSDE